MGSQLYSFGFHFLLLGRDSKSLAFMLTDESISLAMCFIVSSVEGACGHNDQQAAQAV